MAGFAVRIATLVAIAVLAAPAAALAPPPLGDPTPHANNAIHAVYSTRVLDSLEGFEIGVELRIHEVEFAPAGPHAAAEIRAAPEGLRALFEEYARAQILAEVSRVLPESRVGLAAFSMDYGLEDYDLDPYDPPIAIHALVHAAFTPAFFGLAATTHTSAAELARALLYSGGSYVLEKDLDVPAGYDVEHVVDVPGFLELWKPGAAATGRLVYHADNFDAALPDRVRLHFGIQLRPEGVPGGVASGPLVSATFIVDDATPVWKQSLPFLGGDYVGHLDLAIDVNSLDVSLFGSYPLPRQVHLSHVSADLLRVALRERLILQPDVEAFFEGLIRRSLEESFGPHVQLGFDWSALSRSLNEPVGGRDGKTVAPLAVRAHAELPFASNRMLVSSTLGRLVGMTVGTSGEFDLENDGLWDARYTVAYPKGVHVSVDDSSGRLTDENWGEREGFTVDLPRGSSTHVRVEGRSDFDATVFAIGLAEVALGALFLWSLCRRLRVLLLGKRAPGSA